MISLAWAVVGCEGSSDGTPLQPTAGSGGSGGSGSSGGSGGSPTLTAGNGGTGGSPFDAGADATSDATGPSDLCVPGSLASYCADHPCPAFADAQQALRQPLRFATPVIDIVQRSCVASDGSARVSVAANYGSWTRTFIYDAETRQLTGVVLRDDVGPTCDGSGVFDDELSGFYGERARDCEWHGRPAACDAGDAGISDAGASDAGPDAGPQACVLTP
jgi:hypothetical protein